MNRANLFSERVMMPTGQLTPDEALDQVDAEVRSIFQKSQERGKM